jgi:DNA-directed RNA polymerase specialized sigma24 family protein
MREQVYPHPNRRRFPPPGAGVRFKSEEGPPGKRSGPGNRQVTEAPNNIDRQIDDTLTEAQRERQVLERRFLRLNRELIALRRQGRTLEEIAQALGVPRLTVHRILQKAPSTRLKIELGVPTGGGLQ